MVAWQSNHPYVTVCHLKSSSPHTAAKSCGLTLPPTPRADVRTQYARHTSRLRPTFESKRGRGNASLAEKEEQINLNLKVHIVDTFLTVHEGV